MISVIPGYIGMRPGEVMRLCWPDVDFDWGAFIIAHTLLGRADRHQDFLGYGSRKNA